MQFARLAFTALLTLGAFIHAAHGQNSTERKPRFAKGGPVSGLAGSPLGEALVVDFERDISETTRRRNEVYGPGGKTVDFAEAMRESLRAKYGDRTPPPDDPSAKMLRMIEAGEIWTEPSTGLRRTKERWAIAADGSFRLDLTDLRDGANAGGTIERTFVCIPADSARAAKGSGTYEREPGRRLFSRAPDSMMHLQDFRRVGAAEFEQPTIAAALAVAATNPELAARIESVQAVDDTATAPGGWLVTVHSRSGARLFEVIVDREDDSRCLQSRVFDQAGRLARVVTHRQFEPVDGSSRMAPREIEIVEYRDGQAHRTDRIRVRHIKVDAAGADELIADGVKCPEGWTRVDDAPPKPPQQP